MTNKISTEAVTEAITRIVKERGEDFVYQGTADGNYAYTEANGSPSCLVGCVLAEVAPEFLAEIHRAEYPDGTYRASSVFRLSSLERVLGLTEIPLEDEAITALRVAQIQQDEQAEWGYALKKYGKVLDGTYLVYR